MTRDPSGPDDSSGMAMLLARGLAVAWLVGFTIYFFSQPLPNASTAQQTITRRDVWELVPELLIDSALPSHELRGSSGWRFFPQRLDLILLAGLVLAGAWHLGSLLLRGIAGWCGESFRDDRAGRMAAAGLLGLAAWSLIVLAVGLMGLQRPWLLAGILFAAVLIEQVLRWREPARAPRVERIPFWKRRFLAGSPLGPLCVVALTPFVAAMLLGSMLPSTDFDVKAYHLVGPKEWFLKGRIEFLPHNVYTSFPFLTEMLCLSTMVLRGDWFRGALAGQLVLATFAPLTAMMAFSVARRLAGPRAGWLAAFVYLTTPWVCRTSIIAYVEGGLAAYLIASLWAAIPERAPQPAESRDPAAFSRGQLLLCGLFTGCAAACKYPGVISAVIPFGLLIVVTGRTLARGAQLRQVLIYGAGVLLAFGPWLLKNLIQTGNPVYPLLWGLFDGRDFDAALAAKFRAGHALPVDVLTTPSRWIPDLWAHLRDVAVGSDWQSVLVFGLLPASCLAWRSLDRLHPGRRGLWLTAGYAVWLFLTWWGLTHRIDRFWVPMLSILAVLAGVAADQLLATGRSAVSKGLAAVVLVALAAGSVFNLGFDVSPLIGFNGFLMNETQARELNEPQSIKILNGLPADSRTLLVGEAQVFECRREVLYHTVFNHCLFEEWFAGPANAEGVRELHPPAELREELERRGVTHVFVNWLEVLRYRTTYGYSPFVTPGHVQALVDEGILALIPLPGSLVGQDVESLPPDRKQDLQAWGRELIRRDRAGMWFPAYQLFEVRQR